MNIGGGYRRNVVATAGIALVFLNLLVYQFHVRKIYFNTSQGGSVHKYFSDEITLLPYT